MADKVETSGVSQAVPGLPDTNYGSAAGSLARTGDAATEDGRAATPQTGLPLGEGRIIDDAAPAGKRRQVSREPPRPPPGVILQAALGDRSLELSSSGERDHSMLGVPLETTDSGSQQRLLPHSRLSEASPRVRAHMPQLGRDKRGRTSRSMPLSRGASPKTVRKVLLGHEMVPACRAGGDQDVEARLRVLEQQREDDHRYFAELRDAVVKLGNELDRKTEKEAENARYLQELTARGLQFQQSLAIHKTGSAQSLKSAQEEVFKEASELMDRKIAEVVVGTTEALNKLQSHVLFAFAATSHEQAEDKKIIEQTFVDASLAVSALQSSNVPTSATCPVTFATGAMSSSTPTTQPLRAQDGRVQGAMVFTKAMCDDIDKAITSIKKTASDQIFVTGRVDLLWGQVEAQSNVVQVHESAIQILQSATAASTSAPCQPCGHGVSGAMGVSTDDGSSMPKPRATAVRCPLRCST